MAFVSELTGRPVTDFDGTRIGFLKDLVAHTRKEFAHPVIDAVVVQRVGDQVTIPYADLAALLSAAIPLKRPMAGIQPYELKEDDLLLVKDDQGVETLIPMVRQFVTEIDEASGTIRLALPEGLRGLNAEGGRETA